MRAALFRAVVAVPIAACGVFAQEPKTPTTFSAALPAPPDQAVVVVYRGREAHLQSIEITDETNKCIGFPSNEQLYATQLAPGTHELSWVSGRAARAVKVELAAGKTYFLRVDLTDDGTQVLTAVKPGTPEWGKLDDAMRNLVAYAVDQTHCQEYIHRNGSAFDWDDVCAKARQAVANLPPVVAASDGVVWKGSPRASYP